MVESNNPGRMARFFGGLFGSRVGAAQLQSVNTPGPVSNGSENRLNDLVVMITGASSGFGEVTARMLVEAGAKVILGARREDRLKALVKEFGTANAIHRATDVTKCSDVEALAQAGIKQFGHIDGLVNNAGIMPLSPLAMGHVDDWDRMIDVNIKGVLYGIHSVLSHMMQRGSGKIINVSSVAGLHVNPATSVYSGTKFAVRAISEGLRQETAGQIQVTTIFPGAFATELGDSITDATVREAMMSSDLAQVVQPPERIAEAILFALGQDPGVSVNELVIRPTAQS